MANGEWRMVGSGEWRIANGQWRAASGEQRAVENSEWRMANGEWWEAANGEWGKRGWRGGVRGGMGTVESVNGDSPETSLGRKKPSRFPPPFGIRGWPSPLSPLSRCFGRGEGWHPTSSAARHGKYLRMVKQPTSPRVPSWE
jgi:hypothetical protein